VPAMVTRTTTALCTPRVAMRDDAMAPRRSPWPPSSFSPRRCHHCSSPRLQPMKPRRSLMRK
jgi:hypothetical protein